MVFSNYYAESNDNCTACGNCIDMCQMEAIEITDIAHVNTDRCIGCGLCVMACPNEAISLIAKGEKKSTAQNQWRTDDGNGKTKGCFT